LCGVGGDLAPGSGDLVGVGERGACGHPSREVSTPRTGPLAHGGQRVSSPTVTKVMPVCAPTSSLSSVAGSWCLMIRDATSVSRTTRRMSQATSERRMA
jgi:hypothetical protein